MTNAHTHTLKQCLRPDQPEAAKPTSRSRTQIGTRAHAEPLVDATKRPTNDTHTHDDPRETPGAPAKEHPHVRTSAGWKDR